MDGKAECQQMQSLLEINTMCIQTMHKTILQQQQFIAMQQTQHDAALDEIKNLQQQRNSVQLGTMLEAFDILHRLSPAVLNDEACADLDQWKHKHLVANDIQPKKRHKKAPEDHKELKEPLEEGEAEDEEKKHVYSLGMFSRSLCSCCCNDFCYCNNFMYVAAGTVLEGDMSDIECEAPDPEKSFQETFQATFTSLFEQHEITGQEELPVWMKLILFIWNTDDKYSQKRGNGKMLKIGVTQKALERQSWASPFATLKEMYAAEEWNKNQKPLIMCTANGRWHIRTNINVLLKDIKPKVLQWLRSRRNPEMSTSLQNADSQNLA